MRNKVYIKKNKVMPYGIQLWIVVSNSISRSIDVIEDLIDVRVHDDDRSQTQAYMFAYELPQGGYRMIMFVKSNASGSDIIHEANHIKNMIFHWSGVKHSFINDENESYLLGWLYDKAEAAISGYNRFIKNNNIK